MSFKKKKGVVLGPKLDNWVKSEKNLMCALEATFSVQYSGKFVTMFVLMISQLSLEMGYVGSKTRSLGQIIEKPMLVTKGL